MRRRPALAAGLLLNLLVGCSSDGSDADRVAASPPSTTTSSTTVRSEIEINTDSGPGITSQVQTGGGGAKTSVEIRTEQILSQLGATPTATGTVITLDERVLFDFGRADIKPQSSTSLAQIAEVVKLNATAPVLIRGHTDAIGDDATNDDLSRRRAQAVLSQLVDTHGINPARLRSEGVGKRQPLVPNTRSDGSDDPGGREKNRRVEVVLEGVRR